MATTPRDTQTEAPLLSLYVRTCACRCLFVKFRNLGVPAERKRGLSSRPFVRLRHTHPVRYMLFRQTNTLCNNVNRLLYQPPRPLKLAGAQQGMRVINYALWFFSGNPLLVHSHIPYSSQQVNTPRRWVPFSPVKRRPPMRPPPPAPRRS